VCSLHHDIILYTFRVYKFTGIYIYAYSSEHYLLSMNVECCIQYCILGVAECFQYSVATTYIVYDTVMSVYVCKAGLKTLSRTENEI
jgi:hypothetical protein